MSHCGHIVHEGCATLRPQKLCVTFTRLTPVPPACQPPHALWPVTWRAFPAVCSLGLWFPSVHSPFTLWTKADLQLGENLREKAQCPRV